MITKRISEREIAEMIATRLFTNGLGDEALRLVLEMPDGRDGGGWGKKPATDQIEMLLASVKATKPSGWR